MTKEQLKRINGLFHFTDRRNLPFIREHGGLFALAELKRRGIAVPAPGGNDWSHDEDVRRGLDEYVHLCFRWTHPMEYVARSEGRISDSVYLNVHPEVLQWEGVLFTPDVSNKSGVEPYPIDEASDMIDYEGAAHADRLAPILRSNSDWLRRKRCEILVPGFIPLELIRNFPNG